jgi:two-component sensor histidine kinase
MAGRRAGLLAAAFPTVRARLLALLLVAAVPLLAMAVSIAWRNYLIIVDRSRQQALLVLQAAEARNDAVLRETDRLLALLAASPDLQSADVARCQQRLGALLSMVGDPYRNFAVLDGTGRVRCAAWPMEVDPPILADLRAGLSGAEASGRRSVAGPLFGRPPKQLIATRLALPGSSESVVVSELVVDWLHAAPVGGMMPRDALVWSTDRQGKLIALGSPPAPDAALPVAGRVSAVLSEQRTADLAPSRDGPPYAYASADLPGGSTLLVAVPASASIERADAVLGSSLAELGLLLLAGLAGAALGAHVWVVRPLNQLTTAVRRWRAGGPFDPGPLDGAPVEVTAFAASFAHAGAALRMHEAQLQEAATRQELLMQEVHHRVKNNLQIVASLLNLQASRIRLPAARAEFQSARDRIRALATLHRHLYAYGEIQTINMRRFLEELCSQLLQAIGETPAGGRIRLDIAAPELEMSGDQAVPIALIVTEAVSNSAKYAFPGGRSGHISVRLQTLGTGEDGELVRLTIDDDGVGATVGPTDTESGRDGIGLQLIRGFARQLGGELSVSHDDGTHYALPILLRRGHSDAAVHGVDQPAED